MLLPAKFNEFCLVLGVKEMCCLEPEKKILEKAFRKKALKCHPDKVFIQCINSISIKQESVTFQGGFVSFINTDFREVTPLSLRS